MQRREELYDDMEKEKQEMGAYSEYVVGKVLMDMGDLQSAELSMIRSRKRYVEAKE